MELTPQPRHPDEVFYFNASVLIAHETAVQALGPVPRVEVYYDASVVGRIEGPNGVMESRDFLTFHGNRLYGGERLLGVQAGSEQSVTTWDDAGRGASAIGGEKSAEYVVQPQDKLIVVRSAPQSDKPEETIIVPAAEALPAEVGVRYASLGIITKDGTLIAVGNRAYDTRRVVDLAIASKLTASAVDLFLLEQEIGAGNLVGMVKSSEAATAYLQWFAAHYGTDFVPVQDVRDRYDEFPESFTREQRDRYF